MKLLGYCAVDGERGIQRLLVYEFMPNRSLEDHLFNRQLPALPWKRRLDIILGSAEGLAYLHGGLEVQVQFTFILLTSVCHSLMFLKTLLQLDSNIIYDLADLTPTC